MPDSNAPGLNCRGCGTSQDRCTDDACCAPCKKNKTLHHALGRRTPPPPRMTGLTRALLAYIRVLESQRDDARRMVVASQYFTNTTGTVYPNERPTPDHWHYPVSEPRRPPLKRSERAVGARCECPWCEAMPG